MLKLFLNLFSSEAKPTQTAIVKSDVSKWEAQIAQADAFWEQGKVSEAVAIYDLAIEQHPHLPEIKQRLAGRVKHQSDLAIAYQKLAISLKKQGKIEQAANYYRQAINLKALTGNTKNQLLGSHVAPVNKPPIPIASLKETAFSFQPLTNNLAIAKVRAPSPNLPNLEAILDSTPRFSPPIKAINPEQAKQIDWETAQVYFQKALDHLEKQEWEQSALACKQATQIMPKMAEAYKIWGNALQRMGQTGEAMACYARAVEVKPSLADVYAGIADIYAQQLKWQQAIKHYQKAIIIKPSAKTYRKLAAIWEEVGETEKAEFSLDRASELELSDSSTSNAPNLEVVAINHNNIEEAVASYCQAARQLEQNNQWQLAAKYYRQAVNLSMSRPALAASKSTHNKLELSQIPSLSQQPQTQTKDVLSQLDKAIHRYHQQAKLQPSSPKIYSDLGSLYAKKNKFSEAIACYRQAIKLNRQYPNAHLGLARALLKAGKQEEFVKEMQLALALQPNIGTAIDRFSLADVLVEQNQEQQATGFYHQVITLDPTFSPSYHRLSNLLSRQGKHEQAIAFLEQGIRQNSYNPESYYLLALQWEKLENWDKAVKTYSQVLQIEPQYPEASKKLNHALAQKLKHNLQMQNKSNQ